MRIVFDIFGMKKTTKVEACVGNDFERSTDSKLRDIHLITSGHSQTLCNLIKVINDQKNLIQNSDSRIRRNEE